MRSSATSITARSSLHSAVLLERNVKVPEFAIVTAAAVLGLLAFG
jgi:hypothetical protein